MASIDITHPHSMAPAQARMGMQELADKLVERFGVQCDWDGDILNFTRAGIDGHIALLADQIHVTAELGFMLGAFKDAIETEIRRVLERRFG